MTTKYMGRYASSLIGAPRISHNDLCFVAGAIPITSSSGKRVKTRRRVSQQLIHAFYMTRSMQDSTDTKDNSTNMPHSVSPDSTSAEDSSRTISQVDTIKSEPGSQDVAMDDAPSPPAEWKPKVNLEELFDDEDSDEEFPSSAPVVKSEEESSQLAPLYI
jgi:hypothetical protein